MFKVKKTETRVGLFNLKWKRTVAKISLSDEEVAERLGISVEQFYQKMDDPKQFTETERIQLSAMLGIPVPEILEELEILAGAAEKGEAQLEAAMDRFDSKLDEWEEKW